MLEEAVDLLDYPSVFSRVVFNTFFLNVPKHKHQN